MRKVLTLAALGGLLVVASAYGDVTTEALKVVKHHAHKVAHVVGLDRRATQTRFYGQATSGCINTRMSPAECAEFNTATAGIDYSFKDPRYVGWDPDQFIRGQLVRDGSGWQRSQN